MEAVSLTSLVKLINNLQIQQPDMSFSLFLTRPLFLIYDFLCFCFCFLVELRWFVADLLWVGAFGCFEQHFSRLWVNESLGVGTFPYC